MIRVITFLVFGCCISTLTLGQSWQVGIINDPDGYTNVRSGQSSNYETIDKILEGELFLYKDSTGQGWLEVQITRCNCDEPNNLYNDIEGYMHRSRIQNINEVDPEKRKTIFKNIFLKEGQLFENYGNESRVFHEYQFGRALKPFADFICEFKDAEMLNNFMQLMRLEEGSADEAPSWTLGRIFVCEPDWTFKNIRKHMLLMDKLEWGLVNVIYRKPKEEADEHKRKYNELRTAIGMSKVDFSLYE